jgi:hypothetical protein
MAEVKQKKESRSQQRARERKEALAKKQQQAAGATGEGAKEKPSLAASLTKLLAKKAASAKRGGFSGESTRAKIHKALWSMGKFDRDENGHLVMESFKDADGKVFELPKWTGETVTVQSLLFTVAEAVGASDILIGDNEDKAMKKMSSLLTRIWRLYSVYGHLEAERENDRPGFKPDDEVIVLSPLECENEGCKKHGQAMIDEINAEIEKAATKTDDQPSDAAADEPASENA